MRTYSDIKEKHLLERGFVWVNNDTHFGYINGDWFAWNLGMTFVTLYHPRRCNNGENKGVQFDLLEEFDRVLNGEELRVPGPRKFTEFELKRGYFIAPNGMCCPTSPVASCIYCNKKMDSHHYDSLCSANQINAELIAARKCVEILRKLHPPGWGGRLVVSIEEEMATKALAEYDKVTKR